MTNPLVTVCLNSFNRPRLIRDAIDSVLAQTWPNIQLIICDDYSNPETHDVIDEYAMKWAHVVYPPKEPTPRERQYGQRCSVCINAAMPYARGEFICYLPDDDFLTPRSIEVRAQYLMDHPEVNAVYGRLEACQSRMPDRFLPAKIAAGIHYVDKWPKDAEHIAFAQTSAVPYPHLDDEAWADTCCVHDRNGFWSAEPITRAANRVDHGMMMVRRVPNLPEWPEYRTQEMISADDSSVREGRYDDEGGSFYFQGEQFDCPDAGFFFRLEHSWLGPFYSVDEVVVVKRYHDLHHRTDPSRRE